MSRNLRNIQPVTGILMGALFLFAGLMIVFVALDWIRVDPSSIHAPRWVLGVCGVIFALPGVAVLYYGVRNGLADGFRSEVGGAAEVGEKGFPIVGWVVGLVIAGGLAVVFSWVGFGPGERTFSGSVGVGGVRVGGSGRSESLGRWVFGGGAVVLWLFTLYGLVYGLRRLAGFGEEDEP